MSLPCLKVCISPSLISWSGSVPPLSLGLDESLPYLKVGWVPPLSQGLDESLPYLKVWTSPSLISRSVWVPPLYQGWMSPTLISRSGWFLPLSQGLDQSPPYLKVWISPPLISKSGWVPPLSQSQSLGLSLIFSKREKSVWQTFSSQRFVDLCLANSPIVYIYTVMWTSQPYNFICA